MIDPGVIRRHFPALERKDAHGRPLVFFDNPAGTQICREAIERMRDYLVGMNANHGGAFRASRESDAMVREARRAMADFLGAARQETVRKALDHLGEYALMLRVLGSYPRFK